MNEPSLSSASATSRSPRPSRAWLPSALTLPPITIVGSSPPSASTLATSEVVVVLPCAPAMATPYLSRISSPSISARGMTGITLALAATTSGLVGGAADEDGAPEGANPPDGLRFVQVRPGHMVAERQEHLRDAAHARAAHAYEMNVLNLPEH